MKKLKFLIVFCFVFFALPVFGLDNLEIQIKTSKTVYHFGEPILINFTVLNHSNEPVELKISDLVFLNYFIEAYTLKKMSVKERQEFFAQQIEVKNRLKKEYKNNPDLFKTITLASSQILGIKIDLLEYYQFKPGTYLIQGKFFPVTSFLNEMNFNYSPAIQLIIKDDILKDQQRTREKTELKKELKSINTPDLSVKAFFDGKMTKNWEKFFYVLDIRRLISQFPVFFKEFQEAKDTDRKHVLKDFKEFLKTINSDEQILNYEIIETTIRKTNSIITAVVTSNFKGVKIKREYRFGLMQKDRWYIYEYAVTQK